MCYISVQNGTFGHYYLLVAGPVSWQGAQSAASTLPLFRGVAGHLVTISSAAENAFVKNVAGGNNIWIGGNKTGTMWTFTAGPEAGTTITYTNWNSGSPGGNTCLSTLGTGFWVDTNCATLQAYVVEYECPYGGVFTAAGCSIAADPVNGHFYEVVITASYTWTKARTSAANRTLFGAVGHLATITGQSESNVVTSLVGPSSLNAWIDVSLVSGDWVFSTGSEAGVNVSVTNWQSLPTDSGTCGLIRSSGLWDYISCLNAQYFVVEYECVPGYAFNATGCYGLNDDVVLI